MVRDTDTHFHSQMILPTSYTGIKSSTEIVPQNYCIPITFILPPYFK